MKRVLVFGSDNYYPCGGVDDVVGIYETLEGAQEAIRTGDVASWDNYQILDTVTMKAYTYSEVDESFDVINNEFFQE